jgi:hypothetical protein
MAFNINLFKQNGLTLGGARPSLFQVEMTLPGDLRGRFAGVLPKFTFTCRASSIPASSVASFDVPYFGRKIKLAGDRTFADWNVTVMNDEDFEVRKMFEAWSSLLNHNEFNTKEIDNNNYKASDAIVKQFSKSGGDEPIASYVFNGLFPTEISAMDLDWDSTNTVQTFNVTFAYDYWIAGDAPEAGAGGPPPDVP